MRARSSRALRTAAGCGLVVIGVNLGSGRAADAGTIPPRTTTAEPPAGCNVTHPNGRTAPGERPNGSIHGEHGLWTPLPLDGVLRISTSTPLSEGETFGKIHRDGSLSTKFPWWGSRAAAAKLTIRGKRLDGHARQLRLTVGPGATANSPHFWATRLRFAKPGCWKVTAKSGRAHLTFTVAVQHADD